MTQVHTSEAAPARPAVRSVVAWRPRLPRSRAGILLARIAVFVLVLAVWEFGARDANASIIVPPSAIFRAFVAVGIDSNQLWVALGQTVQSLAVGFIIGLVAGVAIGVVMGRYRRVDDVLDPWVFFLYAIPNIALIPLLVLAFGIDSRVKIVIVVLSAVFPVILNTAAGVKNIDAELIDTGRSFCASEHQLMWTVILPASIPFISSGARIALSQALVGVIGAEFLVVVNGLGGMIVNAANMFQTAVMFVPMFVIMGLAIVLTSALRWVQARLTRWDSVASDAV